MILCINIPYNGLLTCSKWQLKMLCLPNNYSRGFKISLTTLLIPCIKMCVDHCSKNINCSFRLCWLLKLSLAKIKQMEKNLTKIIGDIFWQDQLGKLKFYLIQQFGYLKVHGLIFTGNFMVWRIYLTWQAFTNNLWKIQTRSNASLIRYNLSLSNYQMAGKAK